MDRLLHRVLAAVVGVMKPEEIADRLTKSRAFSAQQTEVLAALLPELLSELSLQVAITRLPKNIDDAIAIHEFHIAMLRKEKEADDG